MPMCQHKLGCYSATLAGGMEGIENRVFLQHGWGQVEEVRQWLLRCRGTLCVVFGLLVDVRSSYTPMVGCTSTLRYGEGELRYSIYTSL
jgi:hypothetical protein